MAETGVDVMDRKVLERRLREYADGACVMNSTQFSRFYGVDRSTAARMLADAEVEKVAKKWFIPSIVERIAQGVL